MSQSAPLTPEIIGRAIDNTPLNSALKFIIGVAAAGFLFDSFDITIVVTRCQNPPGASSTPTQVLSDPRHWPEWARRFLGWAADTSRRVVFASTVLMFPAFTDRRVGRVTRLPSRFRPSWAGRHGADRPALVTDMLCAHSGRLPRCCRCAGPWLFYCCRHGALLVLQTAGAGCLRRRAAGALSFVIRRRAGPPRWLAAHGRSKPESSPLSA